MISKSIIYSNLTIIIHIVNDCLKDACILSGFITLSLNMTKCNSTIIILIIPIYHYFLVLVLIQTKSLTKVGSHINPRYFQNEYGQDTQFFKNPYSTSQKLVRKMASNDNLFSLKLCFPCEIILAIPDISQDLSWDSWQRLGFWH